MRIVFVSNFFNHHQKYICEALHRITGGNFIFIETKAMSEERIALGYAMNEKPSYVVTLTDPKKHRMLAQYTQNADVLIYGSAELFSEKYFRSSKALCFRYAERPLKRGIQIHKYPYRYIMWHRRNPKRKNIFVLCASAYTASDYAKFGLFKKHTYKWGYFPETKKYDDFSKLLSEKKRHEILWCGRFLDWKNPEDAIRIAIRLKNDGYHFVLNIIGNGILEARMREMIEKNNLTECVHLLGSMKPEKVREHMESAGIYLFTSNFREGWGAVLNESMNSGCAVVASDAVGSVPFLLKSNENGYIYESENINDLYEKVKYLLDHPEEQVRVGRNAYQTIIDTWNSEKAAERLVELSEHLLNGESYPLLYEDGPCSYAKAKPH